MNIFILDDDFKKCAQYHCDKHVVKMITEYAQMLSTACRLSGINHGYRITHQNHPCTKWVRKSLSNWLYLKNLAEELNKEWQFRYNHNPKKLHKSFELICNLPVPNIPDIGLTKFAQAMPDKYKTENTIEAYRNYYIGDKQHIASWKNRKTPDWFERNF